MLQTELIEGLLFMYYDFMKNRRKHLFGFVVGCGRIIGYSGFGRGMRYDCTF